MRCYTVRRHKLVRSCLQGFTLCGDGDLVVTEGPEDHQVLLDPLDGGEDAAQWGRLHVEIKLADSSVLNLYAYAADSPEEITGFLMDVSYPARQKREFFLRYGAGPVENQEDMLLYGLRGRYLWILAEVDQGGAGRIGPIRVMNPGDNFMQTLPEIYQERGGFLHRYLSVFSSIYNDFEEETSRIQELFDPYSAPCSMLPVLGDWLGIDLGDGLLDEPCSRRMVANAGLFVRMKGTRRVVREMTLLLTGEDPLIIEKADGNVTILLKNSLTEEEELRLLFFLAQFKPVYSRLNVMPYEEQTGLDEYCFVDVNAALAWTPVGKLDFEMSAGHCCLGGGD